MVETYMLVVLGEPAVSKAVQSPRYAVYMSISSRDLLPPSILCLDISRL
jgi:hypothetical protein